MVFGAVQYLVYGCIADGLAFTKAETSNKFMEMIMRLRQLDLVLYLNNCV